MSVAGIRSLLHHVVTWSWRPSRAHPTLSWHKHAWTISTCFGSNQCMKWEKALISRFHLHPNWTHCWTSAAGIIVPQSFAGKPFMFVWSLIGFPLRSTSFGASKPARSQNAPPHHTGKGPVSTFLWIPIVTEVLLWTKWMGYLHSKPESSHRIYQFNPIYLKSSASVTPVLIITNTVPAQVAHTSRRLISPLSVIKWSW